MWAYRTEILINLLSLQWMLQWNVSIENQVHKGSSTGSGQRLSSEVPKWAIAMPQPENLWPGPLKGQGWEKAAMQFPDSHYCLGWQGHQSLYQSKLCPLGVWGDPMGLPKPWKFEIKLLQPTSGFWSDIWRMWFWLQFINIHLWNGFSKI